MTLFWGSSFDTQAKQNLRQALSRLRKLLGSDALASEGEAVSLNTAVVLCDVGRFEALIREGSRDAFSAAAGLYRGRLMDNVAISEEGWSEWLAAERARLHDLAVDALVGFGRQELAAGGAELALRSAQRAIALNNMREDAHRLIVQALAATGRKAEALKHYQDLVRLLKRELNTEPDEATRSLAAELRSARPQSGSPAAWDIVNPDPPAIVVPPLSDAKDDGECEVNGERPFLAGDEASARMKVLVVDDHPLIRAAAHAVLKQLKREAAVLEASSGHQTIEIIEKHPDTTLVLLDIGLPDQDGFCVLRDLRDRYPAIAIIMMSASHDRDEVKRAFSLGALGYIPKTTGPDVMLYAIELVLSGGLYIPPAVLQGEGPTMSSTGEPG